MLLLQNKDKDGDKTCKARTLPHSCQKKELVGYNKNVIIFISSQSAFHYTFSPVRKKVL